MPKKVYLAKSNILLVSYFVSIVVAVPATSIITQDKIVLGSIFLDLSCAALYPNVKCPLHAPHGLINDQRYPPQRVR